MCDDGRHSFGLYCARTSTFTCRTCAYVHLCGDGCLHTVTLNGQSVCTLTGRCGSDILIHQYEQTSCAELSSYNTTLLGATEKRTEISGEDDRLEAARFVEQQLVRGLVRKVFESKDAPRADINFSDMPMKVPLVQALVQVLNAKAINKRSRGIDSARLEDIVNKITAYYRWCCAETTGRRVPRLRVFTVAMLYVMRTGIRQGPVVLAPKCKHCEAMLPAMTRLSATVLQDKQRSLTSCTKFIKITISDAVQKYGSAAKVARRIEGC
jgi:hypothetical protein